MEAGERNMKACISSCRLCCKIIFVRRCRADVLTTAPLQHFEQCGTHPQSHTHDDNAPTCLALADEAMEGEMGEAEAGGSQVHALTSRLREMTAQQDAMQAELDTVSQAAKESGQQARYVGRADPMPHDVLQYGELLQGLINKTMPWVCQGFAARV